jgi:hypothetical protein
MEEDATIKSQMTNEIGVSIYQHCSVGIKSDAIFESY